MQRPSPSARIDAILRCGQNAVAACRANPDSASSLVPNGRVGSDHTSARSAQRVRVTGIAVTGSQRTDPQLIRSWAGLLPGDLIAPTTLGKARARLLETYRFTDVDVRADPLGRIDIIVRETPLVRHVETFGNKSFDSGQIRSILQLESGGAFSKAAVRESVQRLLACYRECGVGAVRCDARIVLVEENKIDVFLSVEEGAPAIHDDPEEVLPDYVSFQDPEHAAEPWAVRYTPQRLRSAQRLLHRFYLDQGYAGFSFRSVSIEPSHTLNGLDFVTYTADPGPRIRIERVEIESDDRAVALDGLTEDIAAQLGPWYVAGRATYLAQLLKAALRGLRRDCEVEVVALFEPGAATAHIKFSISTDEPEEQEIFDDAEAVHFGVDGLRRPGPIPIFAFEVDRPAFSFGRTSSVPVDVMEEHLILGYQAPRGREFEN